LNRQLQDVFKNIVYTKQADVSYSLIIPISPKDGSITIILYFDEISQ